MIDYRKLLFAFTCFSLASCGGENAQSGENSQILVQASQSDTSTAPESNADENQGVLDGTDDTQDSISLDNDVSNGSGGNEPPAKPVSESSISESSVLDNQVPDNSVPNNPSLDNSTVESTTANNVVPEDSSSEGNSLEESSNTLPDENSNSAGSSGGSTNTSSDTEADTETSKETDNSTTPSEVDPEAVTPLYSAEVTLALASGNAEHVATAKELLSATLDVVEDQRTKFSPVIDELFTLRATPLEDIYWNPSHDAALLRSTFGTNVEVLASNNNASDTFDGDGHALAIAGTLNEGMNEARYMVYGSNPLRHWDSATAINEGMKTLFNNGIDWLTQKASSPKIVTAQLDNSYYFKDDKATYQWLTERFGEDVSVNEANSCDDQALAACLTPDTQLLIISQVADESNVADIVSAIKTALSQGISVLYVHHNGNLQPLGKALFNLLDVHYIKDNYWPKEIVDGANGELQKSKLPTDIDHLTTTMSHLLNDDFSFDIDACDTDSKCSNLAFNEEFLLGAQAAQEMIQTFDNSNIDIFKEDNNQVLKLAILFADKLRQNIQYPLNIDTTPTTTWLSAYFADHLVYSSRQFNAVQPDMGNFSRSDFSHITPSNHTVVLESKKGFRSAGVYALPGQTVKVTRVDDLDVVTSVQINAIRSGSTHEWDEGGYKRPKFIKSNSMLLMSGVSTEFTSPYGGPIMITFDAAVGDVEFTFENIGRHAYWGSDSDTEQFQAALAAGDFDWAELSTPSFEVHSQLGKMQESASNDLWSSPSLLAEATMTYTHNYPLLLAGYQGFGIDVVDEIHNFAQDNGLTIYEVEAIKHMNADQALCGYGCSGNPYDAYWAFNPIGHGDIHEVGHGLEKSRFRFPSWDIHTTTNPYSYYSKSRFHQNTGESPSCQSLPFDDLSELLLASKNSDDAIEYMQQQDLTVWNRGVVIYIQMMMAAQDLGELENGWHLWARLHIIERELSYALKSDELWQAKRDGLGFSNYSFDEAKAMSNSDFMLIAISHGARLDYRDFFAMWGIINSDKATQQVALFEHDRVPASFYQASGNDYCLDLDKSVLTLEAP